MNLLKQMHHFKKLDALLKLEKTGKPRNFANQLRIKKSHLYWLMNVLKDFGAKISYSRKKESFYYKEPFKLSRLK